MVNETVWLFLNQMAELFDRDKSVIAKHIKNIFEEAQGEENRTVAKFATVQKESSREFSRGNRAFQSRRHHFCRNQGRQTHSIKL
jgi:hypothetical protein